MTKQNASEQVVDALAGGAWHQANVSAAGTHLVGELTARYSDLVRVLGEPCKFEGARGGDGKVSTEWILQGIDGSIFTLYDYKDTSLYEPGLPSPEAFRFATESHPYAWHIGGREKPERLVDWLRRRIAEEVSDDFAVALERS